MSDVVWCGLIDDLSDIIRTETSTRARSHTASHFCNTNTHARTHTQQRKSDGGRERHVDVEVEKGARTQVRFPQNGRAKAVEICGSGWVCPIEQER